MPFFFNPDAEEFIPKQRRSTAIAESAMVTVWREERLGVTGVSKHPDSEDESIGDGVDWDG